MIVTEHILQDIVSQVGLIVVNNDYSKEPSFMWGNEKQLMKYLKVKKDKIYPLVWLLPSDENYKAGNLVNRDCEIIIATRETRDDYLNDTRWNTSFDIVLNPLVDKLVNKIKSHHQTVDVKEFEILKAPNYSKNNKNGTIDHWDAIKLSINITFKEC